MPTSDATQITQQIKILSRSVDALTKETKETNRLLSALVKAVQPPRIAMTEDKLFGGSDAD